MPYFDNDPQPVEEDWQPVFQEPVEDDYLEDELYEDTGDYLYDDYFDEQERQEAKRLRWRLIANVGDFLSVLAGTVVILLLIALLVSLITWVQGDLSQTFVLLQTKL